MTRTRIQYYVCACWILTMTLSPALCRAQQKTLISDTLFEADGSRASGTATITWPAFTSPDNFPIAQGTLTINIANGSISVQLVPTIGATPAGTSYTVSYFLSNSVSYTEYWTVPTTGPVTLTQVRTTPVPVPTTTFGEQQLTLGNGFQTPLGIWRQSSAPVATNEGQCYWDLATHAIKCTDQTLTFNALGGSDPSRVSKAGDTLSGSLLAANNSVALGSTSKPFGAIYENGTSGFTSSSLTLTSAGIDFTSADPTAGGNDPNARTSIRLSAITDAANLNPGFSNVQLLGLGLTSVNGQNDFDATSKKSFVGITNYGTHYGEGQRFTTINNILCFGMGDCFDTSDQVTMYGGVNALGDEGTGFRTMNLVQASNLVLTNVASNQPVRTTCNTTTTQSISRNIASQQVTVGSASGCNVGNWIVIDRGGPTNPSDNKIEAVKITAVSAGVITGVFVKDHVTGAPVTPGLALVLGTLYQIGQGRTLVDESQPAYTTGTITSISGKTMTGTGVSWTANMVGGDAMLPGCISLAADDVTSPPFSTSNVLHSWYPISSITSNTLTIAHMGLLGSAGYQGNGPGTGAYTILPCARILNFDQVGPNLGSTVILESTSGVWAPNDTVEAAISVDGAVSGEYMRLAWFTPGANLGGVYNSVNSGGQTFAAAFTADQQMTVSGKDAYTTGLNIIAQTTTPIAVFGKASSGIGIRLISGTNDTKAVYWGGNSDSAAYSEAATGDLVLTRNFSNATLAPTIRLNRDSSTTTVLGNLTASFNGGSKIRVDDNTQSNGLEFRVVSNSAIDGAYRGLDIYMDSLNRVAIGLDNGGQFGINSSAAATLSSNSPSYYLSYGFETFNGVSSDKRYIHTRAVPDSGIVATSATAPAEWQLYGTKSINGFVPVFAGIKTTGILRFGNPNKGLLSLDASNITTSRSLTLPDTNGTVALTTTPGTTGTSPNWTATGGLNIPLASAGSVTAGLLSNSDYLTFSAKENALTFSTPLSRSSNTISCPTCEVTGNKNIASGYAGLNSSGKLITAQGQKIWAATDLTTFTSTSGSGSTALQTTISAPVSGQVLTWSGTDWINQALPTTSAHNLLSSTHTDTTPATVVRGDVITGQGSTTTWQRLALGSSGRYLRSNGTDLIYSSVAAGGAGACGTNQWISSANDNATPTCSQPAFSNLSGTAGTAQLPGSVVYNNQANAYSAGLQDFGAATAVLPKSSDPGSPATGQVWINSGFLKYRDNSGSPATQVVEIQSNKNVANGYAGLTASALLAASQFPALTGDITTAGGTLTAILPSIVAAGTNTKLTYNAKGQVTAGAQAQFSDIGGVLGATQFPALTGDITTTAGSLTATLPNIVSAGTNTKITYNAKGQVTAGAQAAATDLSNGTSGSGSVVLASSPTVTDLIVNQNANGDDTVSGKRKTDTSPAGNLIRFLNAAGGTDLFTVDTTGTLQAGTVPGTRVSGNIAGTAATATALASTPSQCGSNQYATGIAASGNANCSQPSANNLSNGTTGSGSVVLATSPTITTPTISGAVGGNVDLGSNAVVVEIGNDTATGTSVNQLAKLTGATSAAIKASTSDTSGVVGIVVAGAGTSGNAQIAQTGRASCAFDGGTIAGDYVQISSSVSGDCHDVGSSYPSSGQLLGRVLTTNGSAGTYAVNLQSGELASPRIFVGVAGAVSVGASSTTFEWASAGNSGFNATESTRQFPLPVAGIARSLFCNLTTAQPSTGTLTVTLRKNSTSTALVVVIPASAGIGNYSDVTDAVPLAAGDLISLQLTNSASGASGNVGACSWTLQ